MNAEYCLDFYWGLLTRSFSNIQAVLIAINQLRFLPPLVFIKKEILMGGVA